MQPWAKLKLKNSSSQRYQYEINSNGSLGGIKIYKIGWFLGFFISVFGEKWRVKVEIRKKEKLSS